MSGWWFAAGCIALYVLIWFWFGRKWKRDASALAARRPNPTRAQFVALLSEDAGTDIAEFLWDELAPYWAPDLTPHPGDDFVNDLPIDRGEPQDWLERYCEMAGYDAKYWSEWNAHWPTTVRQFSRWLATRPKARA